MVRFTGTESYVATEDLMMAVNAAIAKLQFRPNPVARSLAGGRSMSIGVVVQAIDSPFYAVTLAKLETGLFRANYSVVFVSGHFRPDDERRCIDHLLSRRVDGIVLMTSCLPDAELVRVSRHTPLVVTGRYVAGDRICSLDVDNTPGARLATDFLLGQGHQRIAFIGGPDGRPDALQRMAGYKAALAARGIAVTKKLVAAGEYTDVGGYTAMHRLLDSGEKFTAVFAANDESAYGALLALHRRGLLVPRDISIVGFDDLPASSFTIPPLTTVHRAINEIGSGIADAMVDLIHGRGPTLVANESTLALRESTRPLRG